MTAPRPFTPETLAKRWECSPTFIRTLCGTGKLTHFRLGKLYRIPAQAVEDYECQTSVSGDLEAGSASTGGTDVDPITIKHVSRGKSQ